MDPSKTTTPAADPPPNAYDAMASAFDSLMEPSSSPDEEKVEPAKIEGEPAKPNEAPKAEGEPAKPAEAAKPEGEPAKVEDEPSAEGEPPKAEGEPPKAESEAVDWEARFKELEAKVMAKAEPAAKPPEEIPPEQPREPFTKDEQEFLATYEKEWSDISRAESLKRRAENVQLVTHVFKEIARVYGPLIERGAVAAETVADTAALQAIMLVHKDYDDAMYDAVVEWTNGLTGYRQKAAKSVIESGDPNDVIDLISEYKAAKGLNKPKVVAGGTPPAAPATNVTELPAKAKQAAKALGVVDSKRTAATTNPADPDDFDAAWEEAVGK